MSVFVLPEGLLFPHVEADGVTGEVSVGRLRIRKAEQSGSKYHTVAGSSMTPLCIGLRRTFPVVVVESDLDAMLVSQEAGDLVGVVALGSVTNRPDEETFRILRRVPLIIVSLDSDPPAARESRQYWERHFPRSVRCPIPRRFGKDPGEAFRNGLDIRTWVVSALKMADWSLPDEEDLDATRLSACDVHGPSDPLPIEDDKPDDYAAPACDAPVAVASSGESPAPACAVGETPPDEGPEGSLAPVPTFEYITDDDHARKAVASLLEAPSPYGADIETAKHPDYAGHPQSGLDPHLSRIRLVQICAAGLPIYVFDFSGIDPSILAPLWDRPMVFHNALFDIRHILHSGANPSKVGCTMLMDNALAGGMRGLADLAEDYLGLAVSKAEQTSDWNAPHLTEDQLAYAALDACLVLQLYHILRERLAGEGLGRCYALMRDAQRAVAETMLAGLGFDVAAHADVVREWEAQRDTAKARVVEVLGPDIDRNSPTQVARWFETHLDEGTLRELPRTKTGQISTAAESLAAIGNHPAVRSLIEYKAVQTLLSTFGAPYARHVNPVTRRLHGGFRFCTSTGRMRCKNPNVQNAPRQQSFRALFVAKPGHVLLKADYNQMQLRVVAELSQDATMLEIFREGRDIHRLTAAAITGKMPSEVTKSERSAAKKSNFGFIFGIGPKRFRMDVMEEYSIDMTFEEAKQIRSIFFRTYPGVERWHRWLSARAKQTWSVTTPGGRVRRFPRKGNQPPYTEVLNTPVQGGEAEVLLSALALFPERLGGLDAKLVNVVHDEVLFEVAEADVSKAVPIIEAVMVEAMQAVFPDCSTRNLVDISVGKDWGNTAKYCADSVAGCAGLEG